jgi:hypothetical protein
VPQANALPIIDIKTAIEMLPIGSAVSLRIDGAPSMSVVDVYMNDDVDFAQVFVECVWFSTELRLQRDDFPVEAVISMQRAGDYLDRLMREREAPNCGASPHADQG